MKRIFWIDFGKGFGIFLVVLAHVLANIANNVVLKNDVSTEIIHFIMYVLFLIIMPIFFAMSGYLFRDCKIVCVRMNDSLNLFL